MTIIVATLLANVLLTIINQVIAEIMEKYNCMLLYHKL